MQLVLTPTSNETMVVRTTGPLSSPGSAVGSIGSPLGGGHGLGKSYSNEEYTSWGGYQVFELPIKNGALIHSAKLRFTANSANETNGSVPLSIAVHDVDDAPAWPGWSGYPSMLNQAWGTWIDWPTERWPNGSVQETPELAVLVQHIVNRPGWQTGNNLRLFVGIRYTFTSHRRRGFGAVELFVDVTQ